MTQSLFTNDVTRIGSRGGSSRGDSWRQGIGVQKGPKQGDVFYEKPSIIIPKASTIFFIVRFDQHLQYTMTSK